MSRFPFGIPNSWYLVAYSGENWGLGYSLIRQTGHFDTAVVTSFTAIDRETTCIKMGVLAKRKPGNEPAQAAELDGYMKEHAASAL